MAFLGWGGVEGIEFFFLEGPVHHIIYGEHIASRRYVVWPNTRKEGKATTVKFYGPREATRVIHMPLMEPELPGLKNH